LAIVRDRERCQTIRPNRAAVAGSPHWNAQRQPFLPETSSAGVFAAGDVRSGSVKRFTSAVGEGAMARALRPRR
jgi:thioredoxin reductase (NADPH)